MPVYFPGSGLPAREKPVGYTTTSAQRVGLIANGKGYDPQYVAATAVGVGDSIMASGRDSASGAWGFGWFDLLCLRSNGRLIRKGNLGVGGDMADTFPATASPGVINRLSTDVYPTGAKYCFIQLGTNEVGNGVPPAVYGSNMARIFDDLRKNGVIPIAATIPPRSNFQAQTERMNLELLRRSRENDVRLLDIWSDVTSVTGSYVAGAGQTDGVHPTQAGQWIAASAALEQMQLMSGGALLPRSNSASGGLLTNALFVDDSNADGLADGWAKSGDPTTCSLVPAAVGNWQQMAFNAMTSVANISKPLPSINAGWGVGDKLAFVGRAKIGPNPGRNIVLSISVSLGGTTLRMRPLNYLALDDAEVCFYEELVVPPGVTTAEVYVTVSLAKLQHYAADPLPATITGSVSVRQVQVYNLTAMGLA